jgi:acyl carrier protein
MVDDIKQQLLELVRCKTGVSAQPGDTLAALRIDSLAMAELTVEIEKLFQIRVEEDVLDVQTVDDLADYIQSKVSAANS